MKKLLLAITISAAAMAAGCDSGDDLYIHPSTYLVDAAMEKTSHVITVTSSVDWKSSVLPDDNGIAVDWISADKTGGKAGDEVSLTITVEANTTGERSGTVLLSGDGASARITVTQGKYVAPAAGTLSAPSKTNFAYADVSFVPFEGQGLEHVLFYADTGAIAATGNTTGKIFEIDATAWGTYSFVYKAGKTEGGQFVPEAGMTSGPITIEFAEPTQAAVLKIDTDYISSTSARLMITVPDDGVLEYRVFKNGAAVDGLAIQTQVGYVDIDAPGIYTVGAILSRSGAQTEVYGPASNPVDVTLVITPPPPTGG